MDALILALSLSAAMLGAGLLSCLLFDRTRPNPEALTLYLINTVLLSPPILYAYTALVLPPHGQGTAMDTALARDTGRLVFYLITTTTLFDLAHYILHFDWLFARVHSWHHRFKPTVALASLAMHPAEFVVIMLANITGPAILPPETIYTLFVVVVGGAVANALIHCTHSEKFTDHYSHHMGEPTHLHTPIIRLLRLVGVVGRAEKPLSESLVEPSTRTTE